jgi:hypothetical protein
MDKFAAIERLLSREIIDKATYAKYMPAIEAARAELAAAREMKDRTDFLEAEADSYKRMMLDSRKRMERAEFNLEAEKGKVEAAESRISALEAALSAIESLSANKWGEYLTIHKIAALRHALLEADLGCIAKDEKIKVAQAHISALEATCPKLLSIAKRWAALDAGAWHPTRYAMEKKELIADTETAIAAAREALKP